MKKSKCYNLTAIFLFLGFLFGCVSNSGNNIVSGKAQDEDLLIKNVFDKYQKISNEDILNVPDPERTLIVVYTAQGIIGNGGFRYFFENDFPKNQSYSLIANSYRAIGLDKHASIIEQMVSIFPDSKPQKDLSERRSFLSKYFEPESKDYLKEVDDAEYFFNKTYELPIRKAESYFHENRK